MQYALCPFCLSTLQVTAEQLALKSGVIRCGHCNEVFDANKNQLTLSADQTLPAKPIEKNNKPAYPTPEQFLEDNAPPTIATWETKKTKPTHKLPYGLFVFLFVLIFIAQFIFIESKSLTQNTQLQPIFKKLNSSFNLSIPSYKNLDEIHIIQRQLAPHPKLNDLLYLQLTIKNSALAEQPFPTIKVVLTSSLGEPIAQGLFTKYDYLASNETNDYFAPQALRQINLPFKKPEHIASGFEISFQH